MKYFEVKNLCYSYYKKPLCLKDINFSLQKNEKILILAKEDMGKSTLLKTASLFDDKSFGYVYFEGKDARKIDDKDKKFSLILDNPALLSGSIRKNLDYLCEQVNLEKLTDASIDSLLRLFYISGDCKTKVQRLSKEDKIKLSLLRSFIKNPNIVFVDDIFRDIDDSKSNEIVDDLKMLSRERTAVVALGDVSFNQRKDVLSEIEFDKILYLNLAEGKEYLSVADFEKDLPDLSSLDFFDDKEKQFATIEKSNDNYYFIFEDSKFKFDKKYCEKLSCLNIENGESEDIIFFDSEKENLNLISNEKFCELISKNKVYMYLKFDGSRVI